VVHRLSKTTFWEKVGPKHNLLHLWTFKTPNI
jgi:hypothetical protein